MRVFLILTLAIATASAIATPMPATAQERAVVEASLPSDLSVTVYRDPNRNPGEEMNADWPEGFAMISETRTVTLPPGESTIRFEGVAEGMVAVSAIVTGLPGGTIEKNRNAELLSPAALVNGALGNRITITRTNPATGAKTSQPAIVRTRANGGLVLQTGDNFEAVRCAGIPESLTFDGVPTGLSARPVFSINTRGEAGGTYEVTLTYLAWGFDWQADYVATLTDKARGEGFEMSLLSWLSLVNDNGQSFENAQLLVIAGTLNVESDFQGLADPPKAEPLRLTCYPLGNTRQGSPVPNYNPSVPPPPAPMRSPLTETIMVTGSRQSKRFANEGVAADVMEAGEEALGDLKLYRVPERVTVSAKGLKQVAFLNRQDVEARLLYTSLCQPYSRFGSQDDWRQAEILLVTRNDEEKGLGVSLPQGSMTIFEPGGQGLQLVAQTDLRDYARGQEIELDLAQSNQVNIHCGFEGEGTEIDAQSRKWITMRADIRNANPHPITVRLLLGESGNWEFRFRRAETRVKNGQHIAEVRVPANSTHEYQWKIRTALAD